MAIIAIKNNAGRVRECEEADLPHFAALGFERVVKAEKKSEPVKAEKTVGDK